jgi:hypothetical protein
LVPASQEMWKLARENAASARQSTAGHDADALPRQGINPTETLY